MQGVYTLIILLLKPREITIGCLGTHRFPMGCYTYTGSALGRGPFGLSGRVGRHLSMRKKVWWHIDYLLLAQGSLVKLIVASESPKRMECNVVKALKEGSRATVVVEGFGASDCRDGCGSHLLYFPEASLEHVGSMVMKAYAKVDLKPSTVMAGEGLKQGG